MAPGLLVLVPGLLLPIGAAADLVEVSGTSCPSAAEVTERLQPLLPPGPAGRRARVERVPSPARPDGRAPAELLRIELRDDGGRTLATRYLEAAAPCADLAAAAAVIIAAAWQAEVAPAPAEPIRLQRAPAAAPPPPSLSYDVAAGFLLSFAGSDAAPGADLTVTLGRRGGRLGALAAFSGTGLRDLPLGPGSVSYTRLRLHLGARHRLSRGRLFADLHLAGLLGAVLVEGHGFTESYRSADLDLGLAGGVRVALRLGPLAPFLGVALAGWLRAQQVQVTGLPETLTLPRFEVLPAVGVAVGDFR